MKKNILFFLFLFISNLFQAQESLNMVQVGNLSYNQDLNDIWGYVDHEGKEHALVGCANGFSYVDISNPANPQEVFFIPGSNSIWRDLKTWNNYAYITTEAEDGLLIVDLNDLSGQSYTYWTDYFLRAHNIYIDENGFAYIFGSQDGPASGAIILDLNNDPMNPSIAGLFDDYYLHDGMVRGDTLWGSAVYEGVMSAIDVSDKSNPVILGSTPTSCNFTHNSWVSDDGNYVFTTDEQANCYVGAYDVSNISDIQQTDQIQSWNDDSQDGVIPHNTHFISTTYEYLNPITSSYLVTSYYTSGVTVIDASNPYNLQEVAFFDTSPNYSGSEFEGCWGAYPYLPSGLILASDQQTGLHILEIAGPILGCTNEDATNYDPDANQDDGSCLIVGCTDPVAENYNPEANVEYNEICEYLCDQFFIDPPSVQTDIVANFGETLTIEALGEGDIFWIDENQNIVYNGPVFTTDPIEQNSTFYVFQEQVVNEGQILVSGEENHICDGGPYCDYSGINYNGGLQFQSFEEFTLKSIKVYASESGVRTIQLYDSNFENLLQSYTIDVPQSDENGFNIELNWIIPIGEYIITTDENLNNNNFGGNNPMFKRTTGGITNYPYLVDQILSINQAYFNDYENENSAGFSTQYYYYFYDWQIETLNETCSSPSVEININIHNSNLNENYFNKKLVGLYDLLGRPIENIKDEYFYFKLFEDGSFIKEINFNLK